MASYDVIFTSNTTEAINLAAESLRNEPEKGIQPIVVNTLLEHNSNELPWRTIPGCSLIRLPVDAEGFVDLNELEALLRAYNQQGQHGKQRIKLVAVSGASNVLGVFNNLIARQPRSEAASPFASRQTDVQKQLDNCARAAAQRVHS